MVTNAGFIRGSTWRNSLPDNQTVLLKSRGVDLTTAKHRRATAKVVAFIDYIAGFLAERGLS